MEEKYASNSVFDYDFYNLFDEVVFKVRSNVKSTYSYNSDNGDKFLTIENGLLDEKILEATLADIFSDVKFTVKCYSGVRDAKTGIDKKLVMTLRNVKLKHYEYNWGETDKKQNNVTMVFKIESHMSSVDIEDIIKDSNIEDKAE